VPFKIKNKKKQIIEGDLFPQNYNFKKKNEQKRPTFLLEIDNSNLDISLEEHTTDDLHYLAMSGTPKKSSRKQQSN
jgi:cell division protein YceG involved in septum cleavage